MSRGNERVHVILYTTQKTQKVKKWQDGTLEVVRQNGKFSCKLKSEDGEELETRWRLQDVASGDEIDLGRHLLQIEDEVVGGSNTVENESVEDLDARRSKVVRTVKSDVRRVSPADHRKVVSSDESRDDSFLRFAAVPTNGRTNEEIVNLLRQSLSRAGDADRRKRPRKDVENFQAETRKIPMRHKDKLLSSQAYACSPQSHSASALSREFKPPRLSTTGSTFAKSSTEDTLVSVPESGGKLLSGQNNIHFVHPEDTSGPTRRHRKVSIPNAFEDVRQYCETFVSALYEEINLQLYDLSSRLKKILDQINSPGELKANREPRKKLIKDSKRQALHLFEEVTLVQSRHSKETGKLFLQFQSRDGSKSFAKDDLWILFHEDYLFRKKGRTNDLDQVHYLRSHYFGISQQNMIEVSSLSSGRKKQQRGRGETFMALRGPELMTEYSSLDVFQRHRQELQSLSSLSTILGRPTQQNAVEMIRDQAWEKLESALPLNDSQRELIKQTARWFPLQSNREHVPQFVLLHGPFGTGKTYTLVALIMYLLQAGDPENVQILVAGTTNIAVDNILLGLVKNGFDSFARIGSVKRIHRDILPFACLAGGQADEEIKQLNAIIRSGEGSVHEQKAYVDLLRELKSGKMEKHLKEVSVIGTTCASLSSATISRRRKEFDIVIIDEASQMIEPQSMLPIVFGKPTVKVILAGDPNQLPPTLPGGPDDDGFSLGKTLFTRLSSPSGANLFPVLLDTQYRCHPIIANVANQLFYASRLKNGCSLEERSPLLEQLPHFATVNVHDGNEKFSAGGSFSNQEEAEMVVNTVRTLLGAGITALSIGVICSYRSQVEVVKNGLSHGTACGELFEGVQVSTVDAFQGAERDIILLSTVRTKAIGSLLLSKRRTNVAITRAKCHLILFCCHQLLNRNDTWRKVMSYSDLQNKYKWSQMLRQITNDKADAEG